jgi:hypothetical protein
MTFYGKAGSVAGDTDSSVGGSKHPNRNHTPMGNGNGDTPPVTSSFDMGNKMTAHERHAAPNGGENHGGGLIKNRKIHIAGTEG